MAPTGARSRTRRIDTTLRAAAAALAGLPDGSPRLEAELLLAEAIGWPRTRLLAWSEQTLEPVAAAAFEVLLARRLAGEPMAYIRGRQAFWTLELLVTADTLIPRPETERLVEAALERLDGDRPMRVADLGTGCGAIAAALARERSGWTLVATDRSERALKVARSNFRRLGLEGVLTLRADWLSPFASASLDAVVSNPPYIPEADPHLRRGDPSREPRSALTPGADGLAAIRRIAGEALRCLRPGGLLAVEHGFDQGSRVRRLLADRGYRGIETLSDLAGHERVTHCIR